MFFQNALFVFFFLLINVSVNSVTKQETFWKYDQWRSFMEQTKEKKNNKPMLPTNVSPGIHTFLRTDKGF